jgi:TRAP-type transport system small permease protein
MTKTFDLLDRLLCGVVIMALAAMVVLIASQVAARYLVGIPLYWSEELARHLMIWMFFLGSVIALRRGAHLGIDILVQKMGVRPRAVIQSIVALMLAAFFILMIWQGIELTSRTMVQRASALRYPMGYVYAAVPVSGFLMLMVVFERLVALIGESRTGSTVPADTAANGDR